MSGETIYEVASDATNLGETAPGLVVEPGVSNIGHEQPPESGAAQIERQPPPDDEVEAMQQAGFALIDGAYRPRSGMVVVV